MDIKSLAIIRSVYAAEMVVGGGNYLIVSGKGLAMKEVNPSQIGKAMMGVWEDQRRAYNNDSDVPIETSGPGFMSDGQEPEDPAVDPELFGHYAYSSSSTKCDGLEVEASPPTPGASDQGSEGSEESEEDKGIVD